MSKLYLVQIASSLFNVLTLTFFNINYNMFFNLSNNLRNVAPNRYFCEGQMTPNTDYQRKLVRF